MFCLLQHALLQQLGDCFAELLFQDLVQALGRDVQFIGIELNGFFFAKVVLQEQQEMVYPFLLQVLPGKDERLKLDQL